MGHESGRLPPAKPRGPVARRTCSARSLELEADLLAAKMLAGGLIPLSLALLVPLPPQPASVVLSAPALQHRHSVSLAAQLLPTATSLSFPVDGTVHNGLSPAMVLADANTPEYETPGFTLECGYMEARTAQTRSLARG